MLKMDIAYLRICAANRPKLTKYGTQTQIFDTAEET